MSNEEIKDWLNENEILIVDQHQEMVLIHTLKLFHEQNLNKQKNENI